MAWLGLSAAGGGVTQTRCDFTGQLCGGTRLLFSNARYYDPERGRLTSADSIVPGMGVTHSVQTALCTVIGLALRSL